MRKKESIFSNAKKDIMAGVIVFLIALPLCMAIAQASGAPVFSGIIAGVVGGIVIGFLSGSQLSVSGPAAGLSAIVLVAIGSLGDFSIFLCAVIIAGLVQLILGYAKAGGIANYFPTSVIEGMLAGIGLSIILSQLPYAVGYLDPKHTVGIDDHEAGGGFNMQFFSDALTHVNMGAVIITLIGLGILVVWDLKSMKRFKMIPAGLLVVIVGTLLNMAFSAIAPNMYLSGGRLVALDVPTSINSFFSQFTLPNWEGFANPNVWQIGLTLAIVASIETLLCIEATDKLDPWKRVSSTNQELKAQGIGNMISGLIGGLPITSVIVRSSANINAGAKMKLATITHGVLLLVCVATIPFILNFIPKACLAAILLFTGYRLARPAIFKHMWHAGLNQFIPFVITAVSIVVFDLLKGVGIGLVISVFYLLRNNLRMPFYYKRRTYSEKGDVIHLELSQEVSFLNKASIKEVLENIANGSKIIIDATKTEFIDYDVLEMIKDFHASKAPTRNISMSLVGFKNTYDVPKHIVATRVDDALPNDKPIKVTAGSYKKLMKQLKENPKA